VHLESSSTADERAAQLGLLLDEVDARYSTGPAVVGGDLNTSGAPMAELLDRSTASAMRAADPARFSWPVAYEPLFAVAASHGFGWVDANVAAPTTRHGVEGVPDHVPMHLDWLLVRGLEARRATVVPATAAGSGAALSDHELVAVSVRLIAGA
jgi:endonuclease/exonuclease/phosphatase family metal-dependent hydrolase